MTVTYIDDGRVLDDRDLGSAFERAVTTELALKGMDVTVNIDLQDRRMGPLSPGAEDEDVEMYACDACNGLVKATVHLAPLRSHVR